MEKTKEQILITKLRKAGRKTQMGMFAMRRPGMMPGFEHHRGPGGPGFQGHVPEHDRFSGDQHGKCRMDGGPQCDRHRKGFPGGPEGRRPEHHGDGRPGRFPGMMPGGPQNTRGPGMMPGMGPATMPREMILLALLEAGEGGVRQKDIGTEIGINPSSLSEQINRLEADRYIERTANPEDRRSTLISLTEKGRARAYEVQDERQSTAAELFANLTEEEKDTLLELLNKLLGE